MKKMIILVSTLLSVSVAFGAHSTRKPAGDCSAKAIAIANAVAALDVPVGQASNKVDLGHVVKVEPSKTANSSIYYIQLQINDVTVMNNYHVKMDAECDFDSIFNVNAPAGNPNQ